MLPAKSEEGLKEMMRRMERYLKRKGLSLNIKTKKSKIISFRKEGGRRKLPEGGGEKDRNRRSSRN